MTSNVKGYSVCIAKKPVHYHQIVLLLFSLTSLLYDHELAVSKSKFVCS